MSVVAIVPARLASKRFLGRCWRTTPDVPWCSTSLIVCWIPTRSIASLWLRTTRDSRSAATF